MKITEQLKTQLIEDIKEEVEILTLECEYNKDNSRIANVLEAVDSALAQMKEAVREESRKEIIKQIDEYCLSREKEPRLFDIYKILESLKKPKRSYKQTMNLVKKVEKRASKHEK